MYSHLCTYLSNFVFFQQILSCITIFHNSRVFQIKTLVTFEFLPKYIHNNLAKTIHVLPSEISVTYCRFSSTSVTYCRNSTFAAIGGLRKYVYREAKARRPYLQVACSFHAYAVYPTVRNGINQYIE